VLARVREAANWDGSSAQRPAPLAASAIPSVLTAYAPERHGDPYAGFEPRTQSPVPPTVVAVARAAPVVPVVRAPLAPVAPVSVSVRPNDITQAPPLLGWEVVRRGLRLLAEGQITDARQLLLRWEAQGAEREAAVALALGTSYDPIELEQLTFVKSNTASSHTPAQPPAAAATAPNEPKKVRTVTIRPDGSDASAKPVGAPPPAPMSAAAPAAPKAAAVARSGGPISLDPQGGGEPALVRSASGSIRQTQASSNVVADSFADIAMARTWYQKAKDLGSIEAERRLESLANRESQSR